MFAFLFLRLTAGLCLVDCNEICSHCIQTVGISVGLRVNCCQTVHCAVTLQSSCTAVRTHST